MDTEELRKRVDSFPRWHYQFDLQGVKTPILNPKTVNRHEQRVRYFFEPLVNLYGGSLEGKRVLDLGCNAGFWSLKAIEAGCDYVLGIDGRQMHIDQANLVFEVNQVDKSRYSFRTGNVFTDDFSAEGPFDIVLCLGLMYHVNKPVELLEKMSAVNTDVLVIDTAISKYAGSGVRFGHDTLDGPKNAIDYETVFIPSRRGMIELARIFGYTVVPLALRATNFDGMKGYIRGGRLAFLCAKKSDLSSFGRQPEDEPLAGLEKLTREAFVSARTLLSMAQLNGRAWAERRKGTGRAQRPA
jgi:tRNA (mo5U34)-methyltransferase